MNEDVKTLLLVAMITSLIIVILIVAASGYIFKGTIKTKIGPTFGILLATGALFVVVSQIMGVGPTGQVTTGLVLVGIIAFFIIDANMIMNGAYTKGSKEHAKLSIEDATYASMRLFSDFILIFTLLVQMFSSS